MQSKMPPPCTLVFMIWKPGSGHSGIRTGHSSVITMLSMRRKLKRAMRLAIFAVSAFLCIIYVLPVAISLFVFRFTDFDPFGPCEPQSLYAFPVYPSATEANTIYRNNDPDYEL